MQAPIDDLALAVRERRAILFVGAGVSMSVGLPSWQTLIEHMAEELGLDVQSIGGPSCSYQMLAEYYRLRMGSIGPLRSWMDRTWNVLRDNVEKSRLHRLIVSLNFPIIYTTNYDRNLEIAFEIHGQPFAKIANAKDLARSSRDVTQIIKFHGDFDDDTSLVLTETDYFDRLSFDSPMDVRFKADALGSTILFIGYSMTDTNIRLLMYRLWETWIRSGYENDRPKSFVFMPFENLVQQGVLDRWGIRALTEEGDNPEEALCRFMEKLRARVDEI